MKLIILDLDGTLVDSRPAWRAAIMNMCNEYGGHPGRLDSFDEHISTGIEPLLAHIFAEVPSRLMGHFWELVFTVFRNLHQLTFSPAAVKRAFPTVPCGVLTNKRSEHITNFTSLFPELANGDFLQSADSHRKPSGHWVRSIADRHGVATSDVLLVGDTEVDMLAALDAGSSFAHYLNGYYQHNLQTPFKIHGTDETTILNELGGIIGHL